MVDYGSHAADNLPAAICQKTVGFAEVIRSVLGGVEGVIFITLQGRNPVGAIFIEFFRICYEFLELAMCRNFDNLY